MKPSRRLHVFTVVFCIVFSIWKLASLKTAMLHLSASIQAPRLTEEKLFSGSTFEIDRFVKTQKLSSIFLSPGIQSDSFSYFRTTYRLWPVVNHADAEFGVIKKGENPPVPFQFFQGGSEVDFVRR